MFVKNMVHSHISSNFGDLTLTLIFDISFVGHERFEASCLGEYRHEKSSKIIYKRDEAFVAI